MDTNMVGNEKSQPNPVNLALIVTHFPEQGNEIKQRYAVDQAFRELCADYAEVRYLLAELETDILNSLSLK